MKLLAVLISVAATLAAQSGAYHFVQLSVRGTGTSLDVRNGGGTLALTGTSAVFTGQSAGVALASVGTFESGRLSNALVAGQTLEIHANSDATVLIGSGATPASAGESFDLFVAVRQGTAAPPLGPFSAAYFAVNGGKAAGLVTAFASFTSNAASWTDVLLAGHTAARDDVNREEAPANVSYSLTAGGTGVVRFPTGSDYLSGDRELMVSADGAWMLGYSRSVGTPDIFIAHRRVLDRSAASLGGLYWIGELAAEEPFAFDAAQVRWSAASGTLRADGASRAEIAEQVVRQRAAGTSNSWLATANAYYADTATGKAALVPELTSNRRRNGFHFSPDGLIGAQVGAPGEVMLEHGIFAGVRATGPAIAPVRTPVLSEFGAFNGATFAIGPASASSYITLFGTSLAAATGVASSYPFPTELAGTRVLINGQPAPLQSVSPTQINVHWPNTASPTATVQVSATTGLSNTLTIPIAASSPGVFPGAVLHANFTPVTTSAPARPGETLIIYATGLGAVNPPVEPGTPAPATALSRTTDATLRAAIAGTPVIIEFSGLAPGFAGLYQLNIRVPDDAETSQAAPVAIALSGAYTDIAEIAITR